MQKTLVASLLLVGPAAALVEEALTALAWGLTSLRQGERSCTLGKDVVMRPAGSKGMGVFAQRKLVEGELIGRYKGVITSDDVFDNGASTGEYAFALANGRVVDGGDPRRSNWLRFLNHSIRRANCESVDAWEEGEGPLGLAAIVIRASRDIAPGEELLFNYGGDYWSVRAPWLSTSAPSRFVIDYW